VVVFPANVFVAADDFDNWENSMINRLSIHKTPFQVRYSPMPVFALNDSDAEHGSKKDRTGRRMSASRRDKVMAPEIMAMTPDPANISVPEIMAMTPNPANISVLVSRIKALAGHRLTNPLNPSEPIAFEHRSGLQFAGRAGTPVRITRVNLPDGILITDGPHPDIFLLRNENAHTRAQTTDLETNFAMGMLKLAAIAVEDADEGNWRRTA
jgi:hypothetical protein